MKIKTRSPFRRPLSKILMLILGVLGFAVSCRHEDEYGTPMADYVLQGTVRSKTDSSLLPDIKVSMFQNTVQTNNNGYYEVSVTGAIAEAKSYNVSFQDTDTLNHGNFREKDTVINFPGTHYTGGDDEWYEGKETQTMDIFLEPKP
jgi:putative lipoprotein (rSAM/lipoprotein system)